MSLQKQIYFLVFLSSLCFSTSTAAQTTFEKTYGNIYGNEANSVIQTNTGGYAIAGFYDVEGLFSAEFYVIVTDAQGDTLWARTYGEKVDSTVNLINGSGNEGYHLIQTSDNGFLFTGERHLPGGGTSDAFSVRLSETGELLWSRLYGGFDNDYGISVAQTADDDFVIGGFTETYGAGIRDMYLFKTNALGDTLWTKTYGGPSIDAATDMQQTTDGGFILVGYTFSFGAGNSDVYVIRTDANGDILWQKTYGGELNDIGQSIIQTQDGGFIICGETESFDLGTLEVYVLKINAAGVVEWSKAYGGNEFESGRSIAETEDGYAIAGYTRSFGAGSEDFYLIKTNDQGDLTWAKTYGGNSDDSAQSIKHTDDDGFIMTGYTRSFGAGALDIYLVKTDALGNSDCAQSANATNVTDLSTIENSINSTVSYGANVGERPTIIGLTDTRISDPCEGLSSTELNHKTQAFKISPNPAEDFLTIEALEDYLFQDKTILIYDILGQPIQSYQLSEGIEKIDISMLPSGVLMLSISVDNQHYTHKFVKH